MDELPIKLLGPYQIDSSLGKGAMGLVFSAHHENTGELAAVKVLAPAIASDAKFRERFKSEIESLKTLNHPKIVKLFGYGEHEGHLYYAMELIQGTNLEQELRAGRRFNWRDVTQIGIDVARALKHAHDHGVIHRDLKPANLLVDENDEVKLTDFGIAKLFGAADMTLNGNVLGTVDYMAPEQAAGEATSPRCDLFSLGCVMYALLVGKPPFQGKSIPEVLHKVRYEQHRSANQVAPEIPNDLSQVIDELLEKEPDRRIRTALSLSHRLRAIQQALSISTTDKADFSSDEAEQASSGSSATNLIVNPPPDIAERPTVFLTEQEQRQAEAKTASPRAPSAKSKPKRDHFTRIEPGTKKPTDIGRTNEFSSAVPLLLMLLTVLGGLMGGIWYSTQPLSADMLYKRVIESSADLSAVHLDRDARRFLERYPEDQRVDRIKNIQEEVAVYKLQRMFEIRARGRPETGSLAPIEVICNEAFRHHRDRNIGKSIELLEGIQQLFGGLDGSDENEDELIRRTLQLVDQLLPQWRKELDQQNLGLREEAAEKVAQALRLTESQPETARNIWEGMLKVHRDRSWAKEYCQQARDELAKLNQRLPPSTTPSKASGGPTPSRQIDDAATNAQTTAAESDKPTPGSGLPITTESTREEN